SPKGCRRRFRKARLRGLISPMFHDRTYALLGIVPPPEAEQIPHPVLFPELGPPPGDLPASVLEWYAIPDAVKLASRQDWLWPINELQYIEYSGRRLTVFMSENQGVCRWAVRRNGDDPEVLVSIEDGPYVRCADSFSDHIFYAVWDHLRSRFAAVANTNPLVPGVLAVLANALQPLRPTWNWPGKENYRFAGPGIRLSLWSVADICNWHLRADSDEAFLAVLHLIMPLSNLR